MMLKNIPLQIYQNAHTTLHTPLSILLSNTTLYINSNTPEETPSTANIDCIENISKKLYTIHPFSIIKVDRQLLHNMTLVPYLPSLLFPATTQTNIGSPAIPCIIWHINKDYVLFLISHRIITHRNHNIAELQQQKQISLLLNNRKTSQTKNHFENPLLCYVHSNDIYSALLILQLYTKHSHKHTVIISDTIDIEHIQKHQGISNYKEILISHHFLQQSPHLKHSFAVSSIHGLHNIICGIGTCRLCVEVQEKNNYEICQKGFFQKHTTIKNE